MYLAAECLKGAKEQSQEAQRAFSFIFRCWAPEVGGAPKLVVPGICCRQHGRCPYYKSVGFEKIPDLTRKTAYLTLFGVFFLGILDFENPACVNKMTNIKQL